MTTHRIVLATIVALGLLPGQLWAQAPPAPPPPPPPPDLHKAVEDAHKAVEQHRVEIEKAKEMARKAEAESGPEFTDRATRAFKVAGPTTLSLANISGKVAVSAAAGSEIRLEIVKRARAATEAEGRQRLDATRVDVEERAGRIDVRAEHVRGHRSASVDYTVVAPPDTTLEIRSISGDVVVDGIKGDVRAETVSGDVSAAGLAREASLKTVSGDIKVGSSALDGELGVASVSGDVVVQGFKARRVDAGTVSGDVKLWSVTCEQATVHSVSGDVGLSATLAKGGRYELRSHSGNVNFAVDGKTGFEVDASSFSGTIKTELPLDVRSKKENEGFGPPSRSLRAIYLDGSAQVQVSTFSGTIVITKKAAQ
jgi:DUF4097 and DUF4098 domain-containing protein YvlB